MNHPHNANEELRERLVLLLRAVADAEGFSDDDVKTLCYGCGIDSKDVLPVEVSRAEPTPVEWYDFHDEEDHPWW